MCRALKIICWFCLLATTAIAERLPLKPYTTTEGLAHNEINRIFRDSRGFLWFCTGDGLSRFDGYSFTNYTTDHGLPHPNVTDILESRKGEFWIATSGGLVRFEPTRRPASGVVYTNQTSAESAPMFTVVVPDDEDRRARSVTRVLEGRDSTIWFGTLKGLYRIERSDKLFSAKLVEIGMPDEAPAERYVTDLLEDEYGTLWISAASGLYRRWHDGTTARYTLRDGLPDNNLHDLFQDHRGQLWAGTRLRGFFRFTADETRQPPSVAGVYDSGGRTKWIYQLFETSDHRFWIASNTGLAEFFPDRANGIGEYQVYTQRHGLSLHGITTLGEDIGGNLWLGSSAGATRLSQHGFVTYDERDGLVVVNAIFSDKAGGVCFKGSVLGDQRRTVFEGAKLELIRDRDIYHSRYGRFDGQRFIWFRPIAIQLEDLGWVAEGVTLQASNGEWWLGTGRGLYRFPAADDFTRVQTARPLGVYQLKEGLAEFGQVFRIFEDSQGNIWASTIAALNGLALWERVSETLRRDLQSSRELPPPNNDLARSFGEDRAGNVWIGFSTGLARYRSGHFTFFDTDDGLSPGAIQDIHTDDHGRLWLASSRSGLIVVSDPAAERPAFRRYGTAEGLSSNNAGVITEDLNGNIYVSTGHGIDRLHPETSRIKHFTTADGLPPGMILAAFRAPDGALWFGVGNGLARFRPATDRLVPPPPVLITGLRVAGAAQAISSLGESEIVLPDLAADQNQIQIDFTGLSFAPGDVLRYQYRVSGSDSDWSTASAQRTVNFARLEPGSYQVLVRAVNSDGTASSTPAMVRFVILRPIWQRWWFVLLASLTATALVYGAYRYRLAHVVEIERVRTRIATDLHDDIGANLTRISLLSELAKRGHGNGNLLASIADIARESVSSMNDIVWAISPEHDRLLDLTRRMRQHAEEVFELHDIKLQFNAPATESDLHLPVGTRRDLLLIFKEAVNNVARHSYCSEVSIDFRAERHALQLRISDNGKGFDTAAASDGHGLRSMTRRATAIGGEFKIESNPGRGTSVSFDLRLAKSNVV
jgi:signal transduction histidine kinase/ligand-binding sensor domain-containing protein